MKVQTSTTFDATQLCRVRLEIDSDIQRSFNMFDEELFYKDQATPEAIEGVLKRFSEKLEELKANKFNVFARLIVVSLPHGMQKLETEYNDEEEFKTIRSLFTLTASQLISR